MTIRGRSSCQQRCGSSSCWHSSRECSRLSPGWVKRRTTSFGSPEKPKNQSVPHPDRVLDRHFHRETASPRPEGEGAAPLLGILLELRQLGIHLIPRVRV